MTRTEALELLSQNPTATFNPKLAATMVAALSSADTDTHGLRLSMMRRFGDYVTGATIRKMAKRKAFAA